MCQTVCLVLGIKLAEENVVLLETPVVWWGLQSGLHELCFAGWRNGSSLRASCGFWTKLWSHHKIAGLMRLAADMPFHPCRAIIIRNGEIIPMSSEFTPETERQRLQYLVSAPWVWRSAVASRRASELFWRNTRLLTWEQTHSSKMTYGINSNPTHTPPGSHTLASCVTTHSTSVSLLWRLLSPICGQSETQRALLIVMIWYIQYEAWC